MLREPWKSGRGMYAIRSFLIWPTPAVVLFVSFTRAQEPRAPTDGIGTIGELSPAGSVTLNVEVPRDVPSASDRTVTVTAHTVWAEHVAWI